MKLFKYGFIFIFVISMYSPSLALDSLWTRGFIFPSNSLLYDITFINKKIGFICGSNGSSSSASVSGLIYKTTDAGITWGLKSSGIKEYLYSIKFQDSTNGSNNKVGYAVGDKGTICKSTDQGENWFVLNKFTTKDFYTISMFNDYFGWIIGAGGTVFKTSNQGNTWDSIYRASIELSDACFISNYGWAVGYTSKSKGIIVHTTNAGLNWEIQDTSSFSILISVFFLDKNNGWITGFNGTIIHTSDGGKNWSKQESGINEHVFKINFSDLNNGWATSNYGVILNTSDGRKTWYQVQSGTINSLRGMYFSDLNNGWAVGFGGTLLKYKSLGTSAEDNQTTINNISYYPNPSKDVLNIKLESEPLTNEELEIYDLMGQNLLSQKIDNIQSSIDLQKLNTGIYYCRLKQNGTVFKFEVVK
ncbi:MAG: YCF48-related protein [Candidatus Kapabacteria bacterium]|nr:YCF48-related protein [Candidatus Kapabacteria bacterium]